MNKIKTFDAYILVCGAESVPEQSGGLTYENAILELISHSEHFEINSVLHVTSDNYPHEIECENVIERVVNAALATLVRSNSAERIKGVFLGALGERIDEFNQNHPDTRKEQAVDREIDMRRGK
jgi:hypothetical protein